MVKILRKTGLSDPEEEASMKKLGCVVLLLCSASWAAAAEKPKKFTELNKASRPESAHALARAAKPTHVLGGLTFYTDRTVFNAAHPGIPLEDYSNNELPPNSVLQCPGPFDSNTNNGCFLPGNIQPGIQVVNTTGNDLVLLTPPFFGVNCDAVGPNTFTDDGELDFNPPVMAVGLDLNSNVADTYNIEVFGPGGSLGTTTANGNIPGLFWGVDTVDAGGISRITFVSPAGSGELFCNVAFGQPVPVELQHFDIQ
jgi:hypothetical protein